MLPREMRVRHIAKQQDKDILSSQQEELTSNDSSNRLILSTDNLTEAAIDSGRPINCSLLYQFDLNEIERAGLRIWHDPPERVTDSQYLSLTKNCAHYVSMRGYILTPVSKEEANFPIAFSIRMHRNVAQTEKLLRMIYMPQNIYCIHVDKKAPKYTLLAIQAIADCLSNVFVSSQLYDYLYGSISPVLTDLHCAKDMLHSTVQWKYYINLAGSEFPLKTNLEIVRVLTFLKGYNDVENYPFPNQYRHRLNWVHANKSGRYVLTRKRKERFPDAKIRSHFRKGCAYNTFSRAFIEWVVTNNTAHRLLKWAEDIDSPDELVWATLNNLPGTPGGYPYMAAQSRRNFLSRAIVWMWSSSNCYRKYYIHNICIFSSADYRELTHRPELFANKFENNYDYVILDCLEESLNQRIKHPDPDRYIDWEWIQHLPHIRQLIDEGKLTYTH